MGRYEEPDIFYDDRPRVTELVPGIERHEFAENKQSVINLRLSMFRACVYATFTALTILPQQKNGEVQQAHFWAQIMSGYAALIMTGNFIASSVQERSEVSKAREKNPDESPGSVYLSVWQGWQKDSTESQNRAEF